MPVIWIKCLQLVKNVAPRQLLLMKCMELFLHAMHCLCPSKRIIYLLWRDSRMLLVKRVSCSFLQFYFCLLPSEKHLKSFKCGILLCNIEGDFIVMNPVVTCNQKNSRCCCSMCLWACVPEWGRFAFLSFALRGAGMLWCAKRGCKRQRTLFSLLLFCFLFLYTDLLLVIVLHLRCAHSDFCSELGGEKRFIS